jgi:predicted flap endonuclease-1-like 5' DNA nuclease
MPSSYSIHEIEGIGPLLAEKLRKAGVRTTARLLTRAKTAAGRKKLADMCGVPPTTVLKWAGMADLMRVKGVAGEYGELLTSVGVTTVRELMHRHPGRLTKALAESNKRRPVVDFLPSEKIVTRWIAHAKTLPSHIQH